MKINLVCIFTFLIYSAKSVPASVLECSRDKDCPETATCVNNLCECPFGEVLSAEATRCLPIVIGMGATCEDHQQCAWLMGKYRCFEGRCDCEEGWRYLNGRCLFTVGLHEKCETNEQCFDGRDNLAMACKEGTCVCNSGYYLRGNYDCRPEAEKFGDYCSLESDCKMDDGACRGSKCVNITKHEENLLKYDDQETLQVEETTIVPHSTGQGNDCEKNSDCKSLKNSLCYPLTKKCICQRGYFLSDNTCVAELGTRTGCVLSRQCPLLSSECSGGRCYCRKTYFYSRDNRACQKPMTHDNLFCTNNVRCQVMGTEVTCLTNTCRCKVNAEMDEYSVCRTVEGGGPSDGQCDSDEDCTETLNAICGSNARCTCPEDYRLEKDKCLPNFGGKCDNGTKICEMENSICGDEKVCKCIDKHVQQGVNGCIKASDGLNDTCQIDGQCSYILPLARCRDGICQCLDGYIPVDGQCYLEKYMGDSCGDSRQCHVGLGKSVQCRNSKCQCAVGMAPTRDGKNCRIAGASSLHISGITLILSLCIKLLLGY